MSSNERVLLFNKPFNVLCQFSPEENKHCLADHIQIPDIYPAGRLDYNSEGLLLLTDNGALAHRITDPKHKLPKTYLVQVEGIPDDKAINALCTGVTLKDGLTKPAIAARIEDPQYWERNPPIRERANIPTSWISLTIREGRNRQVRRMTAAVGFPTLRLIRQSIGDWSLQDLQPGEHRWENIPPKIW